MSPTVLLADPAVRFAGERPVRRRTRRRLPLRRLAVGLALAAVVAGLGYLRAWPPLATVMSASMAPTIETGDMVVLKRLGGPPRVGDVVSVAVPEEAQRRFGYPPVVIHRIVRIDADGTVATRGDARKEPDPFTVPATALTTSVVASVPAAGRALAFLTSGLGLLWLAAGGLLIGGLPLLERRQDARRRAEDERDRLQDALASVASELAELRVSRDEAQEDARRATAALAEHLERLPALIERAVADAVAAAAPARQVATQAPASPATPTPFAAATPPTATPTPFVAALVPPPAPAPTPSRFVPASQYRKPPTPDLLTVLARRPAPAWDAPPAGLDEPLRGRRFPARAPVPAA